LGFDLSIRRELKITCINCNKIIDFNAKICPYCGKEQDKG
jgi:RNA polymerase subunit RPABC4/transcription elongation factor Spt4